MIAFAAIAPHGDLDEPLRDAVAELGRRYAASGATTAVVVTPHSVHVEDHFAVVTAARVGEVGESGARPAARRARPRRPGARAFEPSDTLQQGSRGRSSRAPITGTRTTPTGRTGSNPAAAAYDARLREILAGGPLDFAPLAELVDATPTDYGMLCAEIGR